MGFDDNYDIDIDPAQLLGTALFGAEMIAGEETIFDEVEPHPIYDSTEDEKLVSSLRKAEISGNIPAFEQYVYRKCGLME